MEIIKIDNIGDVAIIDEFRDIYFNSNGIEVCHTSSKPSEILRKIKNDYVYTSYIENEQILKDKRVLLSSEYNLWCSLNSISNKLFNEIENILKDFSRKHIQESAGINPQDSVWNKLIKISELNVFPSGFYLQQTKDYDEERTHYLQLR